MNMQTAQALSSAALGSQAAKYGNAFNPDEETVDIMQTKYRDRGNSPGAYQVKVGESSTFEGDQGRAQTNLAASLGGMGNMMSQDFMFNTAGLGQEKEMVSAKEKLLEFQKVVSDGGKLNEDQINDLLQIETQYGSLASRVSLAGEIQKTYDKNLSKMGGKGLFGGAMRDSIAEMDYEVGVIMNHLKSIG